VLEFGDYRQVVAKVQSEKKVKALKAKLVQKNKVIAKPFLEHVQLKRPMGTFESTLGPTTFVRSDKVLGPQE
jgi:hypothetical protein